MLDDSWWHESTGVSGEGVDPPKGLQIPQELVLGEGGGKVDLLMVTSLGSHHDAMDFTNKWIIGGTCSAIHEAPYLSPQIGDDNESLEEVLGKDICKAPLGNILTIHIQVVRTEGKIDGSNGTSTPIRTTGKLTLLIVAGGSSNDLITMNVCRPSGHGGELVLLPSLLLDLCNLLTLDGGSLDLHPKDDVPDL